MKTSPLAGVDLSQATEVKCEKCENDTFKAILKIKRISALLSPTGKPGLIPLEMFACEKCGHVNDELNPEKNI